MDVEVILKTCDGEVICHESVEKADSKRDKMAKKKIQESSKDKELTDPDKMSPLEDETASPEESESEESEKQEIPKPEEAEQDNRKPEKSKPKEGCCFKYFCCCCKKKSKEKEPETSKEQEKEKEQGNEPEKEQEEDNEKKEDNESELPDIESAEEQSDINLIDSLESTKVKTEKPADHLPLYDKKPSKSRCQMKNCGMLTNVYCETCGAHLCFNTARNCYYEYHKQVYNIILDENVLQRKNKTKNKTKPPLDKVQAKPSKSGKSQPAGAGEIQITTTTRVTADGKTCTSVARDTIRSPCGAISKEPSKGEIKTKPESNLKNAKSKSRNDKD